MKMRVLYASGKGKIKTIASLITDKYATEKVNCMDKIPPAYSCDKERLVVLLVSTGKDLSCAAAAYVQPTLFPAGALEAAVPANFNLITLDGDVSGRQSFYGQGAGRYPTAYNVVQDCVSILSGKGFYSPCGSKMPIDNSGKLRFYVRGGWDGEVAETWGDAVITGPVAVAEMHRWLKGHPDAFIAAVSE